MYSANLLVHVVGAFALSQLLFSNQQIKYDRLDSKNATNVLHEALDRVVTAFSFFIPVGVELLSVGAVLRLLVYAIATLYGLYIAR